MNKTTYRIHEVLIVICLLLVSFFAFAMCLSTGFGAFALGFAAMLSGGIFTYYVNRVIQETNSNKA